MENQKCERCGRQEYIPTHQYVKFDQKVQYLCKSCWEGFRTWFIKGSPFPGKGMNTVA